MHGLRGIPRLVLLVLVAIAAAALLPSDAAGQSGGVLVVGDSLEVGTGPHLRRELAPTPVTIDAKTSRPSSVGLEVLARKLRGGHRVVVFDLGVNDDPSQPGLLARNLEAVRERVGDRCLVVSSLSRPPLNGVTIDGMNRVIRDFASATPEAKLFDWRDATESDPGLLGPDRLHPGGAGYAARARMLAEVIGSCGSGAAAKKADSDDEDIPKPENPDAKPPAGPPERRPRGETPLGSLIARLPYLSLVTIGQSMVDRVEAAAREMSGAVSPQPAEPTLGTASGSRVKRSRAKRAAPPAREPARSRGAPGGED
jgi:hypothetical protein